MPLYIPSVQGPTSSTDSNLAAFDGTTGKLIKDGGIATSAVTTLTGTQTLTNKTITSPKINQINDTNGATALTLSPIASAVNYVQLANAATTSSPSLSAVGADTNISINMVPKGTGTLNQNGVPVVTTTGTQTLTNKSLTSPTINTPTILDQNGNTAAVFTTGLGSGSTDYVRIESGQGQVRFGALGASSNINWTFRTKGDGSIYFQTPALNALTVTGVSGSVNGATVEASQTGLPVKWSATGSDANIGINFVPKGSGSVQVNGVPVVTTTGTQTLTSKTLTSPKITSGNAPATAASTGTTGQIQWDANYIYVCVDTNTWKRAALSTWP